LEYVRGSFIIYLIFWFIRGLFNLIFH
jgi:hypothetical protein